MYPRLSDLFKDLLGFDLPLPIYSFGFMVAVAIVTAAWLTRREFDRMYAAGQLAAVSYKARDAENPKGRERIVKGSPSVLVWTMMLLAAALGIAGAKLFYLFERPDSFLRDPLGTIFSPAGLTFYGGLICAGLAIAYYVRRKGLPVPRVADAIAPSLILGYGIGRIGCYLAGDGDWGTCSSLAEKPSWVPGFLWSETFPRNILGVDVTRWEPVAESCDLPPAMVTGVYPTMLYETAMCVVLFALLWAVRKHPFRAGWLFSLYLVLNGIERFLIEAIRLNPEVVFGLSQAQLIAIGLVVFGLAGLAVTTRRLANSGGPGEPAAGSAAA